jgi:VWFA-related protein
MSRVIRRFAIVLICGFAAGLTAGLPAERATEGPEAAKMGGTPSPLREKGSAYVETLEVRLVLLQATVLDRRGEIISGLGPGEFRLNEDGVPQKISVFGTSQDQPLQVAFLLDVSGSMALREKLERAKTAIRRFVEGLQPADQVALLIFADGDVVVKKGFTPDRGRFFQALDPLEAYGKTALRDALAYAPSILAGAAPGRKALVLVTDGVDNASVMSVFEAIQMARKVPVPIYAIGMSDLPVRMRREIRPEEGGRSFFEVLMEFGSQTGGGLIPVFSEEEMDDAVSLVAERLRGQYLIGYRPVSDTAKPGFRRIRLVTTDDRHRVITREGYYGGP